MLAFQLYRLQQVDSARMRLKEEIAQLEALLSDRSALMAAEARRDQAQAALRRAEKALRKAEAEAEAVRDKLRRTEDALYGGRVRNPKELQALQQEAEMLKRLLAQREDGQLEAMMAAEEAEAALQAAEAAFQAARHARLQQEARLGGELDDRRRSLADLEQRRRNMAAAVPPEALAVYEGLLQSRHGLAVATVTEGACDACGAPLTPDTLRAARSSEQLVFCRTCKRILYVP